jgi:hypothetical protein
MGMVHYSAGEPWFLRLLLLHKPAISFEELRTVDGSTYTTFQAAAVASNIVSHETEGLLCYKEAVPHSTPNELRLLFCSLTLQGFATLAIYSDTELRKCMMIDLLIEHNNNMLMADNELLRLLSQRLSDDNKSLEDFGLPEFKETSRELQREQLLYDPDQQATLYQQLLASMPNTAEMEALFSDIKYDLENNRSNVYLLQGQAGCGKSSFANKIAAYTRSLPNRFIVLGCASTGLAASIYTNFHTAHSLFKIPVMTDTEDFDQEDDLKCQIDLFPQRAELLTAARVIIWDEIGSQHIRDFKAVHAALNKFEGKIVLLMGDNKQIAPVVEHAESK